MTLLQNPGGCKNLPPGMGKNWIHRRDTFLKNKQKSAPCGAPFITGWGKLCGQVQYSWRLVPLLGGLGLYAVPDAAF